MTSVAEQVRTYRGPTLFSYGFRPFFFLAALWAGLAIPLWIFTYALGPDAVPFQTGLVWHVHEMVFGYGSAVVAGFLLTAVPNWTGRLPVTGTPLILLVSLWCLGRAGLFLVPQPSAGAAMVDAAFLIVFAGLVWREVIAGRNVRNVKVAVAVSFLAAANAGFHFVTVTSGGLPTYAVNAGLATLLFLILLIGGRIVPSFTRNWMAKHGARLLPAAYNKVDAAILSISALTLAAWTVPETGQISGAALIIAGGLNLARLARWRGHMTGAEPLVIILHVGYAWAAAALLLLGAASIAPAVIPRLAGVHAAGAGAIGVMTLAVMTRATLGHTGRALTAGWGTCFVFVLINLAALTRVGSTFMDPVLQPYGNYLAAVFWSGAFAVFCMVYGPRLLASRKTSA